MSGTLYVTATPIGNLNDLTPRARQTLTDAALIAAEDTRHTRKLLTHFGIKTPLRSCHAHNEAAKGDFFVAALLAGQDVALVSDAGTPCISDPGHLLIRAAADAGIPVVPVCGASAVTAAVSISGFAAGRFAFAGFFPRKKAEQDAWLQAATAWGVVVFYESPLRVTKTLTFLAAHAPAAALCLCNDLTKKYERVYRGTPAAVAAALADNPDAQKGEYTCVAQFPPETKNPPLSEGITLEAQLTDIISRENCDLKTAAARLHARPPRRSKKEIYAAALRLKQLLR